LERLASQRHDRLPRGVRWFVLNKLFVFPASGKPPREEMGCFLLFNALVFPVLQSAAIVLNAFMLASWLPPKLWEIGAHLIAIAPPVFVNFRGA
jgi:putative flippase GtrA